MRHHENDRVAQLQHSRAHLVSMPFLAGSQAANELSWRCRYLAHWLPLRPLLLLRLLYGVLSPATNFLLVVRACRTFVSAGLISTLLSSYNTVRAGALAFLYTVQAEFVRMMLFYPGCMSAIIAKTSFKPVHQFLQDELSNCMVREFSLKACASAMSGTVLVCTPNKHPVSMMKNVAAQLGLLSHVAPVAPPHEVWHVS